MAGRQTDVGQGVGYPLLSPLLIFFRAGVVGQGLCDHRVSKALRLDMELPDWTRIKLEIR